MDRKKPLKLLNLKLSVSRRRMALVLLVLGVSVSSGAQAAEWSLGPEVRANGQYEDNPRLSETGDENEIYGGSLDLRLTGERRTDRSSLAFRPRLYFERYDDSDEDSDDQFFDVFYQAEGQRSEFNFTGNISNQQVRRGEVPSAEFAESDLDDPDTSQTGRVDRRRDRFRWRVKPEYTFDLTQRTRLGANAEYQDVDYNNELPGEAIDYWEAIGRIFVERSLTEKNRLRLTGFASKYDSAEVDNDSKSFGGTLRFERDVSETFTWYAEGGAQQTKVEAGDNNDVDENQTSYLFATGVEREWERTRLQAEASRSVDPSGSGFLKTSNGVKVNLRHQLRPRWNLFVAVYAAREDDVDNVTEVNKRDFARALAKLSWNWTREWYVEAGYRYTYQDYDDTPGDADSNEVLLGVRYRPFPKTWSR